MVVDDDLGATPREFTVAVLSFEDALEHVADKLTDLIDATTNSSVAAALRAARDELARLAAVRDRSREPDDTAAGPSRAADTRLQP